MPIRFHQMIMIFSIEVQSRDFKRHMMGGGPGGVVRFDLGKEEEENTSPSQSLQWRLLQPLSVVVNHASMNGWRN